ncbi:MAG: RecX family transcriptional regulator [Bacteroidota bacterium]
MIITKIERQKKNSNRRSIFVDGVYRFGISEEIFVRYTIFEGKELDDTELQEIRQAENEYGVRSAALKYRSYRPRSKKEITEYLHKKEFDDQVIAKAIAYLESINLVNDQEFARTLCRDRMHLKPVGKQVMKQLLFKKGIHSGIIQHTIEEFYTDETEQDLALQEAAKKMKRLAALPPLTARRRLFDHLLRRGYNVSISRTIVNKLVP